MSESRQPLHGVNNGENQGWKAKIASCWADCWAGCWAGIAEVGQRIGGLGQHFTRNSELGPKMKATVPLTVSLVSVALQAFWWLTTKEDEFAFNTIKVSFGSLVGLAFSYIVAGYTHEGRLRNSFIFLMYVMCAVAILGPAYLVFSSKFQTDDKKA